MDFKIGCDRLTHNYLKVKLDDKPLTGAHEIGHWIELVAQTPKYHIVMPQAHQRQMDMQYPVWVDRCDARRNVYLLNAQEEMMFCKHVEYFIVSELIDLLNESDNYNDTFFDFQEKYWISDLDFSRDKMYKTYERYLKGEIRQKYWINGWIEKPVKSLVDPVKLCAAGDCLKKGACTTKTQI